MRIFITGGAGFIGSHLAESYLADGHEVVLLDDCSTGRRENLSTFANHPKLTFREGSVLDVEAVREGAEGADRIIHLAAAVGVRLIVDEPLKSLETNLRGTEIVVSEAARRKTPLYLASTSEVYGKNEDVPFTETSHSEIGSTTISRWGYACSKMIDEFLALATHRERGLPLVIGRFFNTVGPRQSARYGMVIPRFVEAALEGKPLEVYGTGNQTRCFCDATDVIRFVRALMETPAANGEVVNLGSDRSVSIMDLAKMVVARTKSRSEIRLVSYEAAFPKGFEDMIHRRPDISKLKRLTGLAPKISLEEILDRVIEEKRAVAKAGAR